MKTNRSMNRVIVFVAILTCMGIRVAAAAIPLRYHITELGTLGRESFAYGINESGQVTGFSDTLEEVPLGQSPIVHAFLWKPNTPNGTAGTLHELGSPGVTSYGYGINDRGQVTGIVQTGPGFDAFLWTPTIPNGATGTQLSIGTPDRFSEARAINAGGQITGVAIREVGYENRAFIWNSVAPVGATDRLHYIDFQSRYNVAHTWGYGINDDGRVTGAAWFIPQSDNRNERAFVWTPAATGNAENGTLQDLGTLGGLRSTGFAINAKGLVTGEAEYDPNAPLRHAFLYDGTMHDLGTLGGVVSVGHDINSQGHVIGWSLTEDHRIHPFLYTSGIGMVDLNSLIDQPSGWELQEARGINDSGQIVGTGLLNGEQRAFLLTPVPEPTVAAMYALGGLIAVGLRRARIVAVVGIVFVLTASALASYTFSNIADTTGPFSTFNIGLGAPSINSSGRVAFLAGLDTLDGIHFHSGVFTSNGGPIKTVADTTEVFAKFSDAPFDLEHFTSINNSGKVAFWGIGNHDISWIRTGSSGGSFNTTTIASARCGRGGPCARLGNPSINTAGTVAFQITQGGKGIFTGRGGSLTTIVDDMGPFSSFGDPSINAAGAIAFAASLDAGGSGVYSVSGGATTTIADTTGPLSSVGHASINVDGTVAFLAALDAGGLGIFTGSGGALNAIADTNGPFSSLDGPSINADEKVAFVADLDDGGAGIFTGSHPVAHKVIRIGDPLFGSTLTDFDFFRGLNDDGDIAFRYSLASGVTGIAVANAVPAIAGDYNGDGSVDAADYTVWQDTRGQTGAGLAADGSGNGIVDAADYNLWKANFGAVAGSSANGFTSASATIPELETLRLLAIALSAVCLVLRLPHKRIAPTA